VLIATKVAEEGLDLDVAGGVRGSQLFGFSQTENAPHTRSRSSKRRTGRIFELLLILDILKATSHRRQVPFRRAQRADRDESGSYLASRKPKMLHIPGHGRQSVEPDDQIASSEVEVRSLSCC
jgi:hypothetical protein